MRLIGPLLLVAAQAFASPAIAGPALTVEDVINFKKTVSDEESVRVKAIRQAGIAAGAQGGFSERAAALLDHFCLHRDESGCGDLPLARRRALDSIFMFKPLIDPRGFLPPVITEVLGSSAVTSEKLVVSGKTYRIDRPARFVNISMTWRDYLTVGLESSDIDPIPNSVKPKTDAEREEWASAVKTGWLAGIRSADEVFNANLARLKSDYVGMLRYHRLNKLGLVAEPVISKDIQSQVLTDGEIKSNVEVYQIERPAAMNRNTSGWKTDLRIE